MDMSIDGQDMRCGQVILPAHLNRLALLCFEDRTGLLPLISPKPGGGQLRMQLVTELHHADAIL